MAGKRGKARTVARVPELDGVREGVGSCSKDGRLGGADRRASELGVEKIAVEGAELPELRRVRGRREDELGDQVGRLGVVWDRLEGGEEQRGRGIEREGGT